MSKMLTRLLRNPLTWLILLMLAVGGGSYIIFGLGSQSDEQRQSDTTVIATADVAAEGQPVRPFAAVDSNLTDALLNNNPITNPNGIPISPANVPPIGSFLLNINPELGLQFELPPPPPSLDPNNNALVDSFADIPILSDFAGAVETVDYAGDGCAPEGLPVTGVLTQRFHGYHSGIDVSAPLGTPVVATHSAEVIFAGWSIYGYGYLVILQNDIFITYYAHLTNFNVQNGDRVGVGSLIAWSGSTGNSTGPHVHYETRINDAPVDPLSFTSRGYTGC